MSKIREIHNQLKNKEISCLELIKKHLDLLKQNTHNTVNSLLDDIALELASKVDTKLKMDKKSDF